MVSLKVKPPEKYNTQDIRNYWCDLYKVIYGEKYVPHGYVGYEDQLISEAQKNFNIYLLLVGLENALKNNIRDLRFALGKVQDFFPTTKYPKTCFFVRRFGGGKEHLLWRELTLVESKWFPDAKTQAREKELILELEGWISGIL